MNFNFPIKEGELFVKHLKTDLARPTIVFLHDALGSIQTWKDFPELLAQKTNCNILLYDRLGHGQSSERIGKRKIDYLDIEADILLDLIEELKITKPILFGHSDGGSIALIAAAKRKNNIFGLITEAAHVFVEEITLQGIMIARMNYQKGNLKEKLVKYHGLKTEKLFNDWANTWLSESFRNWSIEHHLKNITCQSLILQGADDDYGSLKQIEGIKNALKTKAKIKVLEKVKHIPHKEDWENVLNLAALFIKKLMTI